MNTRNLTIVTVSMVDGTFLDTLETIAQFVRQDTRPFGGIQLILCGKRANCHYAKLTRTKAISISSLLFRIPSTARNCRLNLHSNREHGQLVSLR